MWLFTSGIMLGGVIGMGLICLLQINKYEEVLEDSEDDK